MMRLQELFADDEAVSPVIGVILMVAITVILAAVIASFVLGLGNQAGNVSPQASFSIDFDNSSSYGPYDGNISVSHESGEAIRVDEVYMRGSGFDETPGGNNDSSWETYVSEGNATASGSTENIDAVVAGDVAEIGGNTDYELSVVWDDADGDGSNTFIEESGPDA